MTDESQKEKLRQHFARRVTNQARVVLDIWQKIRTDPDAGALFRGDLEAAADKLVRYASRFDMQAYVDAGQGVLTALGTWPDNEAPGVAAMEVVGGAVATLEHNTQRRADRHSSEPPRMYRKTPLYIALASNELAARLVRQLEFFGFRADAFSHPEALMEACALNKPETIVMDVQFGGGAGLATVETLQERHDTPVPIIFVSEEDGSIETRLRASRCGGEEFFYPAVDPGQLIE